VLLEHYLNSALQLTHLLEGHVCAFQSAAMKSEVRSDDMHARANNAHLLKMPIALEANTSVIKIQL
jgi:hypothetical protein